jgi:hypothetical protein
MHSLGSVSLRQLGKCPDCHRDNYNKVKRFTAWDRRKIKRRILYLYKKNKDISYKVMRRSGRINLISAVNYYLTDGWGKAVSACGLNYDKIRKK